MSGDLVLEKLRKREVLFGVACIGNSKELVQADSLVRNWQQTLDGLELRTTREYVKFCMWCSPDSVAIRQSSIPDRDARL